MIERGQAFVRAQDQNGKWGSADILDLDEESFRRFVLTILSNLGTISIVTLGEEFGGPLTTAAPFDD